MEKIGSRYPYILFFILFSCLSCTHTGRILLPQEMQTANALFLQKNYKDASQAFYQIQRQTQNNALRQRALLGQTFSQMLLAQNEIQSREVLQLWQTWCHGQATTFHSEDLCIFMTPMLEKWSSSKKKRRVKKEPNRQPLRQRSHPPETSNLIKVIATQKKELKKLRAQIKKRNQNIKELNTKLKALEDINQEIDQKKKGMDF